jgi:hypothetical protein
MKNVMTKLIKLFLFSFLVFPILIIAQEYNSAPFLTNVGTARSAATTGLGTSFKDNANAYIDNPAAASQINSISGVLTTYSYSGLHYNRLGLGFILPYGNLGFDGLLLTSQDHFDSNNNLKRDFSGTLGLGYGLSLGDISSSLNNISVGLKANYIASIQNSIAGNGLGLGLSGFYFLP